jgi:predicted acyltransferase
MPTDPAASAARPKSDATSVGPTATAPAGGATRLVSLDALRGFDMILIVGTDELVKALRHASDGPVVTTLVDQFTHKKWIGFSFYDLIFPLFVFMVGVSLVISLDAALARGGARGVITRLFRRAVVLFLLGVFYSGGIAAGFEKIRWMGVLQRIAISYFFAALIYLGCRRNPKLVAGATVLILLAYWALLSFVPLPGAESISFDPNQNWANYIDLKLLPGRLYNKTWDPEGLLSSVPSVASCLLGVLAGLLLKNDRVAPLRKSLLLMAAGAIVVGLGFAWGLQFPVIKKIWTSSYVLVAGGYSLMLLGTFYLVIDVLRFRRGIAPLVWVGSNALAIYLISEVVDFMGIAKRLVGGDVAASFGAWGEAVVAATALTLVIALAGFMYKKRVFIRV